MEFHVCVVASIPSSSQDNGWGSCKGSRALYERIYYSPRDARSLIFLVDSKTQPRALHLSRVLLKNTRGLVHDSPDPRLRTPKTRDNDFISIPSNQKSHGRRSVGGSTVKVARFYLNTLAVNGRLHL
jgi:hypothetical protein